MQPTPQDSGQVPDSLLRSLLSPLLQPGANLQSTQAIIPGQVASSQSDQIAALQAQAPLNLQKDLKSGMTLGDAMSKYTALKMSPNDIFKNYLTQNTFGPNHSAKLPVENINQLEGMGVTPDALGSIGQIGSFTDKQNAKNAVNELRTAKNYLGQVKTDSVAGNIAGLNANSKAYENSRTIAGLHLSSLIPGASGAQATGDVLLNTLPSSKDIRTWTPDMIDKSFDSVEKTLLSSRGYDYKTLGLSDPTKSPQVKQSAPTTGGGLLNFLLPAAGATVGGIAGAAVPVLDATGLPEAAGAGVGGAAGQALADIVQGKSPGSDVAVSGLLSAVPGGVLGKVFGKAGGAASDVIKTPGNFMTKLNPGKSMDIGGALKDNALKVADAAGGVNFDNVASKIQAEIPTIAKSFSGVTNKDVQALMKGVTDSFKGMSSAKDAEKIYNTIPDSFTATGIAKQDLNSAINQVKKQAISNEIEKAAPGQGWNAGKALQHQAYQAPKTATNKLIKNLPANAIKAGLNVAGLGVLRSLIGL